jgi:hypothetical protein
MVRLFRAVLTAGACVLPLAIHAHHTTFQGGGGGWQMAAPAVGNINSDSSLEIVIAYRNPNGVWLLDAYDHHGSRLTGFPYSSGTKPINVSPTLSDLDGDGRSEILITPGNQIVALRGDGSILWQNSVTSLNYFPDAGFHAITNRFFISGLPPSPVALPLTAEFFSEVSSPIVVDLERDGTKEVLTAWKIDPDKLSSAQDYNPFFNDIFGLQEWGAAGESWSGGVIVSDALSGETRFIYHFHQLVEAGLAVAQLDADAALEVLVLNDADSVVAFDKTQPPGLFGKGMLHKKFGKNLRLLSGSYQTGVDLHAADIDGDGLDEVLVPSSQINPNWQPSESILDDDGGLIWREWKAAVNVTHLHGWFNNAALIPVNPDHDNHLDVLGFTHSHEISFRYWNGIELVSHPNWPKNFAPFFPTPPVVGDIDGDGQEEVIIGTYHPGLSPSSGKLYIFALDGTEKQAVDVPGGIKHVPTIADLDQDGRTEIVLRALDGKVHIISFGGGFPSAIAWASHRGDEQRSGKFSREIYPAGTPIVTKRIGGYNRASFSWLIPSGFAPSHLKIFRSSSPDGPFTQIASLDGSARSFVDDELKLWTQYFYEVRASYGERVVSSVPFAILSDLEENLVVNGGFEQDDDSHWDKWFTGEIPWTNMTGSMENAHRGSRSMEIRLQSHGNNSSITQYSHYGLPEDYIRVTPGTFYSFGGFIRSSGITQNSRHWFEWDSSRTGENTNARPNLPWPSYFTPSLNVGSSAAPWAYLNRVFEMPAGFPNVELRHRYTIDSPGSGSIFIDNVFFRPLPPPEGPDWTQWISFRSRWRYMTSPPPPDWFRTEFDDSTWTEAAAKFGQGATQNIVTALPKNRPAYYFRKQFSSEPGAVELLLAATCTDDYGGTVYPLRLWLNGEEIISGGIEPVSGEGNLVKYFDLTPFIHFVQPGTNTIAVALSNTWRDTWDNVAFDVSLRAISRRSASSATATVRSISLTKEGIQLTMSANGSSSWRLESCESMNSQMWITVQRVSLQNSEPLTLIMPGSLSGSNTHNRFYRLVNESN